MTTKTFTLPFLNNAVAAKSIEARLGQIRGVTHVHGNADTKVFGVVWDERGSWRDIEGALLSMGYIPILRHESSLLPI